MKPILAPGLSLVVSLLASCAAVPPAPPYVVASLEPTRGNSAAGTVWFIQEGSELRLRGRVTGLVAGQQHGFHVHEKGDCSSGDGMSAGGHFNPAGHRHGAPSAEHHAGDLPALQADAAGIARVDVRIAGSVLGTGATDIAGKALVVHAQPDDYVTQPTGNSGGRIACGVISAVPGRDAEGRAWPLPTAL